jgi:2-keto-4-pentenoate hydratase
MIPGEALPPGVFEVATALCEARRARRATPAAPLAASLQTAEQAYAVQDLVARRNGWTAGGVAGHWKSGGPSRSAVLTHAPLPPAGIWQSPADLRGQHFNLRLIEAEVALRLGRDVTAAEAERLGAQEAPRWVDAMAVSIEIVDSRWAEGPQAAPGLMKLADLQSHGALVLGNWRAFEARDWSQQRCTVTIGAAAPQAFEGTHSLGDPAWLVATWLKHATRGGGTVPRGTVVTTGTWCGMLVARTGDKVRAAFDGIGSAEVQL